MMDNFYSLETQLGIDELFNVEPTPKVEPQCVKEESVKEVENQTYKIENDTKVQNLIGDLFSSNPEPIVEQVKEPEPICEIKTEDENDPFHEAFNVFDSLLERKQSVTKRQKIIKEDTIIEPKNDTYMDGLVSNLSKFTKNFRGGEADVVEDDLLEERLQNMQRQLDRMRGIMMESTMVSGIGQGGDGQTPGSGEVRILKMDDVIPDGIEDGNTLVWDANLGKFVPGHGSTSGGGPDGRIDLDTTPPPTTRDVPLEKAAPKMIEVADTSLGRNELWPSQMLTQEDANEGFLSFIVELDRIKPTMFVSDNPPPAPDLGDLWFDSTLLEMRVWYNDPNQPSEELKWISILAPGGNGVAAVSDSPPENPSVGQTWFDSHMLELRVWYVPPGTNQEGKWVSAINPGKASVGTETETELNTYTGGAPETTTVVTYGPSEQETTESVTDTDTNTDTSSSSGY